ncbi:MULTISPECIES: ribosome maturation factor RimP [Persicobacter]|uniref:Ribosome maturation factor RimP n=1 Tax=Persicobacter diffluens TaxID=981 RepID=A0AAN4VVK6_9BACT|nr:ribosome maturation factor [Persicobacter sp. CCB-QB2]GJM59733.1 ribosome maturation factor RimP [Persicobacter diffluens]
MAFQEDLKDKVWKLAEEALKDDQYFVVNVIISGHQPNMKVLVLLDGDDGMDIDVCAEVSRYVGYQLEEQEVISTKYILEVSSPGLDYPLQLHRQYLKNIGRTLKVTVEGESKPFKGELLEVTDSNILLKAEVKEKGKKKVNYEDTEIAFDSIKEAMIVIVF